MTVIRVGAKPEPFRAEAKFLDGTAAQAIDVQLGIDEPAGMLVIDGAGVSDRWALTDIREVPDQAGSDIMVLRLVDDPVRRVLVPGRGLAPRLPNRRKRAPVTRRGKLIGWALAAIASVALIIFALVPALADRLAVYIPPAGERALGEATLTQIRSALDRTGLEPVAICEDPDGLDALKVMETRLADAMDGPTELSVFVLDHPMVNAFALPGGFIILFDGLISAAETPEQVASVLAHEIGHVVSRDPTRHALRSAGSIGVLGLLFGDFAGGTAVLFLANQLIDAQYSQTAEAEADAFAHDLMEAADLPPGALAEMFETFRERFGDKEGFVEHFMAHPSLGDRIEAARDAASEDLVVRPLMSDAEWAALRKICG